MKIKDGGVSLEGVKWQMFTAAIKVEAVYNKYSHELTITSGSDGQHVAKSRHYKGLALDFRTRTVPVSQRPKIVKDVKAILGPEYQVILEKDHLHVEWDPK